MLSPIVGYSYTGRFKPLGFFLASTLLAFLGVSQLSPQNNLSEKKTRISVGLSIGLIASLENSIAILVARKSTTKRESKSINSVSSV